MNNQEKIAETFRPGFEKYIPPTVRPEMTASIMMAIDAGIGYIYGKSDRRKENLKKFSIWINNATALLRADNSEEKEEEKQYLQLLLVSFQNTNTMVNYSRQSAP